MQVATASVAQPAQHQQALLGPLAAVLLHRQLRRVGRTVRRRLISTLGLGRALHLPLLPLLRRLQAPVQWQLPGVRRRWLRLRGAMQALQAACQPEAPARLQVQLQVQAARRRCRHTRHRLTLLRAGLEVATVVEVAVAVAAAVAAASRRRDLRLQRLILPLSLQS